MPIGTGLYLEMEVPHCQNEIKTYETIREVKAHYMAALSNAESAYGTAMRKAEANSSASTSEGSLSLPPQ